MKAPYAAFELRQRDLHGFPASPRAASRCDAAARIVLPVEATAPATVRFRSTEIALWFRPGYEVSVNVERQRILGDRIEEEGSCGAADHALPATAPVRRPLPAPISHRSAAMSRRSPVSHKRFSTDTRSATARTRPVSRDCPTGQRRPVSLSTDRHRPSAAIPGSYRQPTSSLSIASPHWCRARESTAGERVTAPATRTVGVQHASRNDPGTPLPFPPRVSAPHSDGKRPHCWSCPSAN